MTAIHHVKEALSSFAQVRNYAVRLGEDCCMSCMFAELCDGADEYQGEYVAFDSQDEDAGRETGLLKFFYAKNRDFADQLAADLRRSGVEVVRDGDLDSRMGVRVRKERVR